MASSTSLSPSAFGSTSTCPLTISSPFKLNYLRISFPLNGGSFKLPNDPPLTLMAFTSRKSKAAVVTKDSWEKLMSNSDAAVLVEFYGSRCAAPL